MTKLSQRRLCDLKRLDLGSLFNEVPTDQDLNVAKLRIVELRRRSEVSPEPKTETSAQDGRRDFGVIPLASKVKPSVRYSKAA